MMIKVMSQNLMCWEKSGDGTFAQRMPLMKKALTEHGADVIGLQECRPAWETFLDEHLEDFDGIIRRRNEESKESTPIYWKKDKFDKLDGGYFWLSETPDVEGSIGWDARYSRVTCWVLLRDKESGKEFTFFNTHLDNVGEVARIKGIQMICKFVRDKFDENMPLILTGDFNARPESETIKIANQLLCDTRAIAKRSTDMPTYHDYGNDDDLRIIDYIYISHNISCETFDIVDEREGVSYQSDHYGIIAEIDIM